MKKFLFYLFSLLTLSHNNVFAQTANTITINQNVNEVTVFLAGAEVRSHEDVKVKKGRNMIVFQSLSPFLDDNSIQVSSSGVIDLHSVSTQAYPIMGEDVNPDIKKLQDTIILLSRKIELLNNKTDAFEVEKKTLLENQRIGSNTSGVSMTELAKAADFFRERTLKINNELTLLKRTLLDLNQQLALANTSLEQDKSTLTPFRKKIIIILTSNIDQNISFFVRYLISNTGWYASYDLIANDISKPVTLKYKAQVYNNAGINWNEVKLTLSTADPSLDASRPSLTTWNLNYNSTGNEGVVENKNLGQNRWASDTIVAENEHESVAVAELSTSFDIPKPFTIPSDGKPYMIDISTSTLNATYEYLTVPKVDLSAFLIAKVTGWEKINLIDGMANVYFGNTYLGKSKIDTRLMSDTLELSLGRDKQIMVTRAKLEDAAGTKLIGIKKTESFLYEIQIKNNRQVSIVIKVQDQVPVSQESDISVDIEEISGAAHDIQNGKLQWLTSIASGAVVKYNVAFSVKYPKNKSVFLRKQRIIRTPRFKQ